MWRGRQWVVGVVVALLAVACAGAPGGPAGETCTPTRTFFTRQVWASFMSTTCFKCHAPDGDAVMHRGARLVLEPANYPGFIDQNLDTLRDVSRIEYDGQSELLLKPLGQMQHGGGAVLQPGSAEYRALQELVTRLQQPDSCAEPAVTPVLAEIRQLDAQQTFRKAALDLAGRLPTADELAHLQAGGEAALDSALDGLLADDGFLVHLRELFNDLLLTDKYRWRGSPIAIAQLNKDEYPAAAALKREWDEHHWANMTDVEKRRLNDSVGREPLDLIAWVVQHDLPFSEILTADYTVVDDDLARIYGVHDGQTGIRKAQIVTGLGIHVPHAGILTTPAFLNRHATTPTNRSRARARFLLKSFLATDVLKLAERPIDITKVTNVDNPTMNAESCIVCHQIVDPIAGGFRGWDESDYERFKPDRPWHSDMVHPGFGDVKLPSEKYGSAIQWLAKQITHDRRFDYATVLLVYTMVTGRDPVSFPLAGDPQFEGRLRSWEEQDAFFRSAMQDFAHHNRNLKVLFKRVVESPSFRAVSVATVPADRAPEVEALGTGRLLTPEMLDRKILATTGVPWRKPYEWAKPPQDWLSDNGMVILYGGIDSDNITERVTQPNGVMASVISRAAHETACLAVPWEFSRAPADRLLFPSIEPTDVPSGAAEPSPELASKLHEAIRQLHSRLLGEQLSAGDVEIEATYRLFLDTWREDSRRSGRDPGLRGPCGLNPRDGTKLPETLRRDSTHALRAWMAVVTYLMMDSRFVYDE